MKKRYIVAIAALILALVVGTSAPAQATNQTSVYNTGTRTMFVKAMSGTDIVLRSGGRYAPVRYFYVYSRECYRINPPTGADFTFCNSGTTTYHYVLGSGAWYIKEIPYS